MSRELPLVLRHSFSTIGNQVYSAGVDKTVGAVAHDTEALVQAVNGLSWANVGTINVEDVAKEQTENALHSAGVQVLSDDEFENGELSGESTDVAIIVHLSVNVSDNVTNAQAAQELEALIPSLDVSVI